MTLEKVNQMSQWWVAFFNKDMDIAARWDRMADKGFTPENVALSGSVLDLWANRKIQKDFVEQHPASHSDAVHAGCHHRHSRPFS